MSTRLSGKTRSLLSGAVVGAAVGVVVAILAAVRPAFLERIEAATYDQRAREVMSASEASNDIVLIDVSETDIENAENVFDVVWPWPRSLYGTIAQYARRAGARAIVFDWLFQDRGAAGIADDEEFASMLAQAGNAVLGLALTSQPLVARPLEGPWAARLGAYDSRRQASEISLELSAWNVRSFALERAGKVELWIGAKRSEEEARKTWSRLATQEQLAQRFASEPPAPAGPRPVSDGESPPSSGGAGPGAGGASTVPDGDAPRDGGAPPDPEVRRLDPAELAQEVSVSTRIRERDGIPLAGAFPRREGLDPPLAVIAAAPARLGNVHQAYEPDGIMRRHAPLVLHGNVAYPSLALAAFLVGNPGIAPEVRGRTLVLGDKRVPLDDTGHITLNYHGQRVYPHVSAFEVLRSSVMLEENTPPSVPLDALAGKYVVVSATGQALRDLRATPISTAHLGAEVNATALDNLVSGNAIERSSAWLDAAISFAVAVVVSLLMIVLWRAIRRAGVALVATAAVTAGILVGYYLVTRAALARDSWIPFAAPAIGGGLSAFSTLLALSAVERSGKRFVQEALGRYTSTALVHELMEHPEYLSLEWGESREMSVYFSDIQGFTTISEGLSPEQLVALLNDYLTTMTDLVLQHGGVVDKYIGDAIMAFWGAPLPAPDHAKRAVRCAIAMRKRCDEMRATWRERFGHDVLARAGVNSGLAVVGNMGSRHKYNYTVMGDMVNLASRLEGANKAYGTMLMVSESTVAKLDGEFDLRELDRIAVKGKDRAVTVFEVLDEKGQTDSAWLARARTFDAGLALYRAQDFERAREVFAGNPDDPASLIYVERCEQFLAGPPGPEWDGVWRMKEK